MTEDVPGSFLEMEAGVLVIGTFAKLSQLPFSPLMNYT